MLKCSEECNPEDDGPAISTSRGTLCFKKEDCTSILSDKLVGSEIVRSYLWQCTLSQNGDVYTQNCEFYDNSGTCLSACSGYTASFSSIEGKLCLSECAGPFAPGTEKTCTPSCRNKYLDLKQLTCVDVCDPPFATPDRVYNVRICTTRCSENTEKESGVTVCNICESQNEVFNEATRKCESSCNFFYKTENNSTVCLPKEKCESIGLNYTLETKSGMRCLSYCSDA